jgi:hypothetical protein
MYYIQSLGDVRQLMECIINQVNYYNNNKIQWLVGLEVNKDKSLAKKQYIRDGSHCCISLGSNRS